MPPSQSHPQSTHRLRFAAPQPQPQHAAMRMSWTMPVWTQFASQCQFTPSCERACLRGANACYSMCDYNTQCANWCNERLLQCVTRPDPRLRQ